MFIFVLSVAVGLAVGLMLAWHLYLVLTGQTTIEFYFNRYRMQMAKERGETYYNEFDLGYRRNWDFFFGKGKYVRSFVCTRSSALPNPHTSSPCAPGFGFLGCCPLSRRHRVRALPARRQCCCASRRSRVRVWCFDDDGGGVMAIAPVSCRRRHHLPHTH